MNEKINTSTPEMEYITAEAISYSALSRLTNGPKAYLNKDKPTGDFLITGSAVDIMLTESEEEFHNQFYIMTANKPTSEMMLAYTNTMIETDNPQIAMAASGYKRAVTTEKWETEGKPYYDAIKAAGNKMILSLEEYMRVQSVVNTLKTNEFTKEYFSKPEEDIDIQYQLIHYFDYKKRKGKIKLDIVVIDHKEKKIHPKDLKTTGKPVINFLSSYRSYKYYIQGGWFMIGLEDWKNEHYPEYEIVNFEFIVAEMFNTNQPMIFPMSSSEIKGAIKGGVTSTGYKLKGIDELLEDLNYYEKENKWDYPAEVMRKQGRMELELFK